MGQQQSKDELLYQQVSYGNVEGIKSLHREGAGLEYKDREGKTPLILACLNPALYNVAKTLIELGANVNAYRPGRNGGTPLHHAAKRGLENVVTLLLSHGANALLINDDCQTPLEVARAKGYSNVVRAIESHICLYSGWLRELYGPGFLEMLAPQLLSRKVWVVVLPCGSRNLRKPFRLELAVYTNIQDAQPRTTIALWRATMEEPAFNQPNPSFESVEGREVVGLDVLVVMHSNFPFNNATSVFPSTAPPAAIEAPPAAPEVPPVSKNTTTPDEDMELAMAINASIQSAIEEGIPVDHVRPPNDASSSSTAPHSDPSNTQADTPSKKASCSDGETSGASALTTNDTMTPMPTPSAPSLTDDGFPDGPIHYPTIDSSMFDTVETKYTTEDGSKKGESSSCVICFDAPVEGACVPCGHMAGCMSCLNEIKEKKWGCPVCRTNIDQVIKVFSV
ncbi:putative E3 ubiquitin-protein ligase XBAT35 [Bienertia sinuspersici]